MITAQKKQPIVRLKSKALREIRDEQLSTKHIIPAAPFHRLVNEIMDDQTGYSDYRFRKQALLALQSDCESYLVSMFNESNRIAVHCGRETVAVEDIRIWNGIKDK